LWTKSTDVFMPENGQGVLSPVLTPKGVEFEYYGSHPVFTYGLATFIKEAFGVTLSFQHPNIWKTKGTVLKEAIELGVEIPKSMSCALDSRQGFGKKLHCGICTNCLLRRVSLHAAGITDHNDKYYYINLDGRSLEEMSAGKGVHRENKSHLDIAFHAVQSMERFAKLATTKDTFEVKMHAYELSEIDFCAEEEALLGMNSLLKTHKYEWDSFLSGLSPKSWLRTKLREIR